METQAFSFEIKNMSESGTIEGLAAGYGNVDLQGDVIAPGAFAGSLMMAKSAGRVLPMLLHHDLSRPVGRWDDFAETDGGLVAKGKLTLETADAREAFALLRDRALTGLSVGFSGAKRAPGRVIEQADLHEVSLVTIPANPRARVSSIKSIHGPRDLEELLRETGLSGRKSKAAASAAWRAINETDETALAEQRIAEMLDRSAGKILSQFKGN